MIFISLISSDTLYCVQSKPCTVCPRHPNIVRLTLLPFFHPRAPAGFPPRPHLAAAYSASQTTTLHGLLIHCKITEEPPLRYPQSDCLSCIWQRPRQSAAQTSLTNFPSTLFDQEITSNRCGTLTTLWGLHTDKEALAHGQNKIYTQPK